MSTSLAGGALSGRFYRLVDPFVADLRERAAELRRSSDAEWFGTKSPPLRRVTPCALTPSLGLPGDDGMVPLAWRDDLSGVLRYAVRIESRSVPRSMVLDRADQWSRSRHRKPLSDLFPKQRAAMEEEAKRELLGTVASRASIVEGYVLEAERVVFCGATGDDPSLMGLLRELFGAMAPLPLVRLSPSGGWDAMALSVLAAAAKREGGRLTDEVHVRSVKLQDTVVRMDTRSSEAPSSALLAALLRQRPLPTVHRIGFSVLSIGVFRDLDLDAEGVCRVFPAPSAFGLWSDRILRRHRDLVAMAEKVQVAVDAARAGIG